MIRVFPLRRRAVVFVRVVDVGSEGNRVGV